MDVSGEHQNDVEHTAFKVRLNPNGNVIGSTKGSEYLIFYIDFLNIFFKFEESSYLFTIIFFPLGQYLYSALGDSTDGMPNSTALMNPNYCGDCYGGEPAEGAKCCNTCDEVRDAYQRKGWSFNDPDSIEQVRFIPYYY